MSTTESPEAPLECVCGRSFKTKRGRQSHIDRMAAKEEDFGHFAPPEPDPEPEYLGRYRIPIHPQPGIFETTVSETGVTHEQVLEIMAEPSWSAEVANHAITDLLLDEGWVRVHDLGRGFSALVSPAVASRMRALSFDEVPEGLTIGEAR